MSGQPSLPTFYYLTDAFRPMRREERYAIYYSTDAMKVSRAAVKYGVSWRAVSEESFAEITRTLKQIDIIQLWNATYFKG